MMLRRGLVVAVGGVMLALVALTGCGADGEASGEASGAEEAAREAGETAGEEGSAAPAAEEDGAAGGEVRQAVLDPRHIIYTGSITVRVPDVDEGARAATALAERYGGFVGGDRRVASEDDPAEAELVLRVPSDQFTAAVDDLGELGQEESRQLTTEDVTEEVVDLDTQIATAEASVDRTRTLLNRVESIDDIVRIEKELSDREATLASLQARQRTLADLTTLSTITATLLGQDPAPQTENGPGLLAGLATGWRGFTASLTVGLTVLGVLLPWLVALGVPAAAVWWTRRRRAVPPAA
jgi:hypothetical protein